ncbi:MAG: hypothetical protein AAF581_23055 [Planctomycetota bacterium]
MYFAFASTSDAVLCKVTPLSVDPYPDSSHLVVSLVDLDVNDPVDPQQLDAGLDVSHGALRAEVARSICRRRVPELSFRYQPGGAPHDTGR